MTPSPFTPDAVDDDDLVDDDEVGGGSDTPPAWHYELTSEEEDELAEMEEGLRSKIDREAAAKIEAVSRLVKARRHQLSERAKREEERRAKEYEELIEDGVADMAADFGLELDGDGKVVGLTDVPSRSDDPLGGGDPPTRSIETIEINGKTIEIDVSSDPATIDRPALLIALKSKTDPPPPKGLGKIRLKRGK